MSTMSQPVNIVIGSAGRRLYLIKWFREAFEALGVNGRVIVTENDKSSAAYTAGDFGLLMPAYSDSSYERSMIQMVEAYRPAMFFSVNDYELAKLGEGLGDKLRQRGVVVPGLADALVHEVTDKFLMACLLERAGIPTPETVLASDSGGVRNMVERNAQVVVKHRRGSGSSGLGVADSHSIENAIAKAAFSVDVIDSTSPLDLVVVQPYIPGDEFGVDIVGPFSSGDSVYRVLARRKLRMRSGETDKATSVEARDFIGIAQQLGALLKPKGLIDIDVLRSATGGYQVIDINPRFGGGYPFVHLAGAQVPLMYVASVTGQQIDDSWASYSAGVISAKYEEVRISGGQN